MQRAQRAEERTASELRTDLLRTTQTIRSLSEHVKRAQLTKRLGDLKLVRLVFLKRACGADNVMTVCGRIDFSCAAVACP